tara:strand:+ start:3591 stop:3770 length:180 start_codon:yes stop_codon:yes gene_type:complete
VNPALPEKRVKVKARIGVKTSNTGSGRRLDPFSFEKTKEASRRIRVAHRSVDKNEPAVT